MLKGIYDVSKFDAKKYYKIGEKRQKGQMVLGGRFGYFYFFCSGEGKGESEAPGGGGGGDFLLKIPGGPYRAIGYSYTYRIYVFQGVAECRAIAQLC